MTRRALFEQGCTLVDALVCQVWTREASPHGLEVPTMEGDDDAPCRWCGEAGGEACCTAAVVPHRVMDAARPGAFASRSVDERVHWR
jgi:hypothetical protein